MAPDIFPGGDAGSWPQEALAAEYNSRLANSKSVKANGRHYAVGCHYSGRLPDTCMIVDPKVTPCVDIVIDVAATGFCTDRQTTVMIRNMTGCGNNHTETARLIRRGLRQITFHNSLVRERMGNDGTVRASAGDVGRMYAIGTRVHLDGETVVPYQTNAAIPVNLLRNVVVALCCIATFYFPEVISVIRDIEGDTGLPPVSPMEGNPPLEVAQPLGGAVSPKGLLGVQPAKKKAHCETGRRQRVGYSIDMSCDLANSSHYNVHDASQGFSVWMEEKPGVAKNWYFIMPNVHGRKVDGSSFAGVAIKLYHGTAISWDGRVVRHCTSITMPDGFCGGSQPHGHRKEHFANHVYGTYTAAKERIVQAGRRHAAAAAALRDNATDLAHPLEQADPVLCEAKAVPAVGLDNYVIPRKRRLSCS
jgi:hypothetical protein